MAWFRKKRTPLQSMERRDVTADVFTKCKGCGEILYREKLTQNHEVCPSCGYYNGNQVFEIEDKSQRKGRQ